MQSEIKDRIKVIAKNANLSDRQFSLSIGKSESFVRTIKDNVGADTLREILTAHPQINPYWLLLGMGDMFISKQSEQKMKLDSQLYIESLKEQIGQLKEIIKVKDELIHTLKSK